MVDGALFQLAGKVLELLGSITLPEVKLAFGVKIEIENLKNTVSTIQAVILDAEKQSSHSHLIKDWLRKLKDVLHDTDDLLDSFSTEVLRHKVMSGNKMTKEVRIFFSSSNQFAFSLKMGHEIKAIRERLNVIAKDKDDFHFIQSSIEPQIMNRARETYSFVLEDEIVGRENDKKEIIECLFDDNVVENISIIPIVGIGGLGKTTLAQLVYNDETVKKYFELKLWICVSDTFDVQQIVKEILKQLTKEKHEESLEMLQNQLREKLSGKKYLLVLDDLWNEENNKWLLLRNLLMVGARGSRIIVTTRSESVARIIGAVSWHALRGLPEEKAWSLFVKMTFEQGQLPENEAFISLGKEIMGKCVGVPLAIRTIASLLRTKASENEWRSFKSYELSKITQEEENDISSTLKLSYDHLPSYLKQCFAYCRLFPKDYVIDVETLIHLWAAQGFIKLSDRKQRVKDVGQEYFMELLWRSFFQDVKKDELGNIACCKMHDLMHDLATLVAGTESTMLTSIKENIGEKVHHVSFDLVDLSSNLEDSSRELPILMVKGMRIRTVLALSVGIELGKFTCDALISNLNYLRTLDLSKLDLSVVSHSIGELKHLRYLDLSKNKDIEFLPNSITKLLNLQTLKLSGCDSLKELPQGIKKLVNLRHLDTNCTKLTHMPLGLGHLTSLEMLTRFVVKKGGFKASSYSWCKKKQARFGGGLSELKELSNLGGSLWIEKLGHGEDDMLECKATNMKEKQHLEELLLWWEWDDGESECYDEMSLEGLQPHPNLKSLWLCYYMGVKIPSWISSLTNLVHLRLSSNNRLQHLPALNQLPFLKFVYILNMKALEYISDEDIASNVLGGSSYSSSKTPFFPSLSSLILDECPNLKGWWRNSDDDVNEPHHLLLPSFPPCLSKLQILGCLNLTSMPPFPYLKEKLVLRNSSWKVLEQTMKMGATTSTSSSCYFPLSQLQYLKLYSVNNLEYLPEEWLQNLVSLQKLEIYKCDGLRSRPWIANLTSLQFLTLWECPNLTSLPQGIRNLTSLTELKITDCPLLRQRCERQTGEDWSIIAHVPRVILDYENQQEETIFSNAPVHPKGSYAWKSILQAREVIQNGAVWRVGNGQLIDIWNHRWLSETTPGLVVSPKPDANLEKVSDLLLHNPKQWNHDLIYNVFYPWEADVIKGIYVSDDNNEDYLTWPLTSSGDYSVKSAYQMLSSVTSESKAGSSSSEGFKGMWKGIWRIRASNRVRHFMWKAVKESLVTKMNLHRRHVVGDDRCPLCDEAQESTLHSLWHCEQAQVVWRSVWSFAPLYEKHHRTFMDLFECVAAEFKLPSCMVCNWQRRNRVRENQPTWSLLEVGQRARNLVNEFLEAQKQALTPVINQPPVRWTPPPETVYRANYDAAVFDQLSLAGLGVVVRDSGGNIIVALSQKIKLPQTIELAEALAARRAVTLAIELSVFKVMVEGDCMRVVKALNDRDRCLTMYGHVMEETRRLGSCLEFCSFHHVKREGNKLAHSLVRRAVLSSDIDVWVEELLENLDAVFQN